MLFNALLLKTNCKLFSAKFSFNLKDSSIDCNKYLIYKNRSYF